MKRFQTDSYFHIGHTHLASGKPAQDYASAGVLPGAAYAVISDGCSTGGHTDVGARVSVLTRVSAIKKHWGVARCIREDTVVQEIDLEQRIVQTGIRESLGLAHEDMLATALYAYVSEDAGFVHIQGDGVVAIVCNDGVTTLHRYEWTGNMPFYPAYLEEGAQSFIDAHGGDVTAQSFSVDSWRHIPGKGVESCGEKQYTVSEGMRGVTLLLFGDFDHADVRIVALFSDGVTQVDGVDWKDAALELLAYKSTAGEFVKRRMIRGIKDVQKRTGKKGPLDDISCAAILVTEEGGEL